MCIKLHKMELKTQNYENRGTLTKKESFILSDLSRKDKKIFSIKDIKKYDKQAKKICYNLIRKKWILQLKKGTYCIVPLDIGVKGSDSFSVGNFVIAKHLTKPYYISYWTALNYYGFSEQSPKTVFIAANKAKKPLKILGSEFKFVNLNKNKFFGFTEITIENAKINIANKEKTIVDCLDKPQY